ncbi:site-specific integrase [Shewanella baltica]|uniref:Integrase family protein n=1 Tax=Shewanella baltica (strain OS195) TaxID=399599 RepID=A9KVY0_SHEB9|nr:site-specific integrase [Shewanella baltica]ABS10376.1 phage integrase family protein [Shewanella baltica OS185]ABX51554.1 integrase family protein [Shewanella baltica OS195]ADT96553.1 integrase family protein [Shewanella baltica OS678]EHC07374.1 integrase family protein [Shewanella baltica OS625]MCS6129544.1 site-specific integrase [Shewanella baltica]
MAQIILSSDVYKSTELMRSDGGTYSCQPSNDNIGPVPTLFSHHGIFLHEPNSYLFYLKAIKKAKDLSPCSRALLKYYQFLEDEKLDWNYFPPIKRLKPTYQFRSYLLKSIKLGELAHSTANAYMNHVKNFYLWTIHERYLKVQNEQEAPFKLEFIQIQNQGMLAHIRPTFTVQTSDLRINVPKDNYSKNIRPLSPLSRDSIELLITFLPKVSEELRLQLLLSLDSGLRIEEVSTLTLDALKTATAISESQHRFELTLCPKNTGVQTKYGKRRRIEISIYLLEALRVYQISERRLNRLDKLYYKINQLTDGKLSLHHDLIAVLERCQRHEPLFISQQGNPMTRESIESRWIELRALIQQQDRDFKHRFHDLRATYATYRLSDLLNAKLGTIESLELLMGWMGHKDESTTWKYLRYLQRKEVFKMKFGILDTIMHEALGVDNE